VLGIVQYVNVPKPPKWLSYKEYYSYYQNREWETDDTPEDDLTEIHRQERIALADETILRYNRLLDSLVELYHSETDEKKRAAILAKQTITLEKLQRALEKREKLDS
jgi:hypothetical protein